MIKEFKFDKEVEIDNIPIGTQVLMITSKGNYAIGKVMFNPSMNRKEISNDKFAEQFCVIWK